MFYINISVEPYGKGNPQNLWSGMLTPCDGSFLLNKSGSFTYNSLHCKPLTAKQEILTMPTEGWLSTHFILFPIVWAIIFVTYHYITAVSLRAGTSDVNQVLPARDGRRGIHTRNIRKLKAEEGSDHILKDFLQGVSWWKTKTISDSFTETWNYLSLWCCWIHEAGMKILTADILLFLLYLITSISEYYLAW